MKKSRATIALVESAQPLDDAINHQNTFSHLRFRLQWLERKLQQVFF
jgi:hypothetical protein